MIFRSLITITILLFSVNIIAKPIIVVSIKPIHSEVILDLASGTGILSEFLSKRFRSTPIISLDFAQESLKKNPSKYKLCADANYLPLADKSVDMIISNLMMQWRTNLTQLFFRMPSSA